MSNHPLKFSAVIAAAGSSRRMHTSKLFLSGLTGLTFIDELIQSYQSCNVLEIVIVVNQTDHQKLLQMNDALINNVKTVVNEHPENGRFGSIKLGLSNIEKGRGCFFQNIDNPFPGAEVLTVLNNNYSPEAVLIPSFNGDNGHPVLLGPASIERLLAQSCDDAILRDELYKNKVQIVPVSNPDILLNLNTPEDYRNYLNRAKNAT